MGYNPDKPDAECIELELFNDVDVAQVDSIFPNGQTRGFEYFSEDSSFVPIGKNNSNVAPF